MDTLLSSGNILFLLKGLGLTLIISFISIIVSVVLGTLLGFIRSYGNRFFRNIVGIYIEVLRNTPLLLWMLLCAFVLRFGDLTLRTSFALVLFTSAVIAEIVRGGLKSIDPGQFEAAKSQGFTFIQSLRYIILPQVIKVIIPSLLSQVVTTIKDTAFLAGFGILEFTRSGQILISQNQTTSAMFTIYFILGLVYFLICFTISSQVRRYQKQLQA